MTQTPNKKMYSRKVEKFEHAAADCKEKISKGNGAAKNVSVHRAFENETRESIKQLQSEQDFYKEIISAVSHPFYAIDANDYKILMANQAAMNLFGDLSGNPFCYSWTHGRQVPCSGKDHPCPLEIIKKTKKPMALEHTHYDNQGQPRHFQIHAYPLLDRYEATGDDRYLAPACATPGHPIAIVIDLGSSSGASRRTSTRRSTAAAGCRSSPTRRCW